MAVDAETSISAPDEKDPYTRGTGTNTDPDPGSLCSTSRAHRAADCDDAYEVSRFPYCPSKQERALFQYCFFSNADDSSTNPFETIVTSFGFLSTLLRFCLNVCNIVL